MIPNIQVEEHPNDVSERVGATLTLNDLIDRNFEQLNSLPISHQAYVFQQIVTRQVAKGEHESSIKKILQIPAFTRWAIRIHGKIESTTPAQKIFTLPPRDSYQPMAVRPPLTTAGKSEYREWTAAERREHFERIRDLAIEALETDASRSESIASQYFGPITSAAMSPDI